MKCWCWFWLICRHIYKLYLYNDTLQLKSRNGFSRTLEHFFAFKKILGESVHIASLIADQVELKLKLKLGGGGQTAFEVILLLKALLKNLETSSITDLLDTASTITNFRLVCQGYVKVYYHYHDCHQLHQS